ncbi:unnamed protein product [Linum tenue]|uniref:E3 ubiquitin-protein ligase CHFR cysteine rich domain-containing protein n=1 Tax=Linum tenue TaxID=586396 RepID=A0AAV0L423_9ROSI|nr:unnamed protein product [Linum tenue]
MADPGTSKPKLQDIIQSDSSLKRSEEEIVQLDSYAMIHSNIVIETGKSHEHKRQRVESEVPDEDYAEFLERFGVAPLQCLQCGTEYNGFRCNEDTVHLECHACGREMPLRVNSDAPQLCLGCDRPFCGAYWPAQGNLLRFPCSLDSFKPISDRSISIIPHLAHETNQVEKDVTDRCIRQMGRTLTDVVSEWMVKLDNGEIVSVTISWFHFSCTGSALPLRNIIYHRMQLTGLIAGTATSAGHSTITKNMLVEGITSVVRLGAQATMVAVDLVPA